MEIHKFKTDLAHFKSIHKLIILICPGSLWTASSGAIKLNRMAELQMSQDNKNLPFSPDGDSSIQVIPKVETPKMYQVILMNDDYTPMDFVVLVLKKFFGKKEDEAIKIMLDVHQKGAGVAGVYTLEIAEMKVMQSNQFAQLNQYPLKSVLEET